MGWDVVQVCMYRVIHKNRAVPNSDRFKVFGLITNNCNYYSAEYEQNMKLRIVASIKIYKRLQETHHEIRIPERDVTYIVLSVYLLTLIHRHPLNRKQSH